jgi:hypothetical protein
VSLQQLLLIEKVPGLFQIGLSVNHKSSCLGAECKGCSDWLKPPEKSRRSEAEQDMESGTFSLTGCLYPWAYDIKSYAFQGQGL